MQDNTKTKEARLLIKDKEKKNLKLYDFTPVLHKPPDWRSHDDAWNYETRRDVAPVFVPRPAVSKRSVYAWVGLKLKTSKKDDEVVFCSALQHFLLLTLGGEVKLHRFLTQSKKGQKGLFDPGAI